jgi:hypothetical protein
VPTQREILDALARIADNAFAIAVVWHVIIALALVLLIGGWRPHNRTAALLIVAPIASAAVVAWAYANPFNGAILTIVAVVGVALAARLHSGQVARGPQWSWWLGAAMVAFAWVYPHFLTGRSPLAYLYGSPVGLIPCPTLALVIGVTLLGGGLGARAFSTLLGSVGALYALFGAIRLGVLLDLGLLAGAVGLLALAQSNSFRRSSP